MRPLLGLSMIVRNEAKSIRKVLELVKPFIDGYCIVDTGSTDSTQDIVREVMVGVPGVLHEEPFIGCDALGLPDIIDFAATRNRALDLANSLQTEFLLVLSGDEYLRNGAKLREHLEAHRGPSNLGVTVAPASAADIAENAGNGESAASETSNGEKTEDAVQKSDPVPRRVDCHFLRVVIDGVVAPRPLVFRTGSAWRYEDEVHEFPANRAEENAPVALVDSATFVEHIVSDPEARLQNIWEKHILILKAKLENDPGDERALIYLAQSYESLFMFFDAREIVTYAMTAMSLRLRRLAMKNVNPVERNFITMHYLDDARLACVYSKSELFARVTQLCEADPRSPEAALMRAEVARDVPMTAQIVYELADHAAEVASRAGVIDSSVPVDMGCAWKAHHLAAVAAGQLQMFAMKAPEKFDGGAAQKYASLMRDHISKGMQTAGILGLNAWEIFKNLVNKPKKVEAASESAPVAS
jgi:glycosyltransferase involved in cell wall biosynthesis